MPERRTHTSINHTACVKHQYGSLEAASGFEPRLDSFEASVRTSRTSAILATLKLQSLLFKKTNVRTYCWNRNPSAMRVGKTPGTSSHCAVFPTLSRSQQILQDLLSPCYHWVGGGWLVGALETGLVWRRYDSVTLMSSKWLWGIKGDCTL